MSNPLVQILKESKEWIAANKFPENKTTRTLRQEKSFVHQGVRLGTLHRTLDQLCDLMAGVIVTRSMKRVLEIGTLFAYSTLHLAEATSKVVGGGTVDTIDYRLPKRKWATGEEVVNIHEAALKFTNEAGYDDVIKFHSGRSDALMPEMVDDGRKFDLIFIDGSHSKYVVALDVINSINLLEDGGLIFMDDIGENIATKNNGGPNEVVLSLLASGQFDILPISANTLVFGRKSVA